MRAYRYTAFTAQGRRRTGSVVAETERDAAVQLQAQDLFVSELSEAKAVSGARSGWRRRLTPELQAVFTRQMAVLLEAELPVDAALEAVRAGGHPALDAVAAEARAALLDGAPLSAALEGSGAGFGPYYLAALRAGEGAGELSAVCSELATYLEEQDSGRAQIVTALIYPGFVAAVSLLVCGILMVNVAPEIVSMFEMTGRPLPPLTQAVMGLSDWIGRQALVLILLSGAGVLLLLAVPRVTVLRSLRDRLVLRLPILGPLRRQAEAVQYMRTLALVLGSRHAVLSAVDSAAEVLSVASFRNQAETVSAAVRQGESLARALERLSFLPPVARQLIGAGEISVRLAPMTKRAAVLTEQGLSARRKRIAALLEPMLMILVGVLVLVIVLAVLLPIFDLQAAVTI